MKRRYAVGLVLALMAVIALSGAAMAARHGTTDSFINGSFESGSYDPVNPSMNVIVAGTPAATAIDGWTVTSGNVDWTTNEYWIAQDGIKSIDLNGNDGAGTISQTFATVPGTSYIVQFYVAPNADKLDGYMTGTVSATGAQEQSFTVPVDPGSHQHMAWRLETYAFVATSDPTTLSFTGDPRIHLNTGPVIDNVSVTPDTGAGCKGGGWQHLSDASGHPFKNQGACVSFHAANGQTPIGH